MNTERWNQFTLPQKMGNIGSEVARARLAKNPADLQAALSRVLEMIDATVSDLPTAHEKKELLQARTQIALWYDGESSVETENLENYFTQFAFIHTL